MTVPTLPGTPWPPPICLFTVLDYGGEALVYLLLVIILAVAYPYSIWISCKGCHSCCCKSSSSCCEGNCICTNRICTWITNFLIAGFRIQSVFLFPGLFKMLKAHDKRQSKSRRVTRKFILFLDRRVENNFQIIISFYFLSLAIFITGLLALFRHIPVDISSECLRRDDQDRDLFCYTNGSTWPPICTALPVDCAKYNDTYGDIEETDFVCYALSYTKIGIAIAAAAALAKVVTVSITIYIKVSEIVHKKSCIVNETSKYKCIWYSYNAITVIVLVVVLLSSWSEIATIIVERVASGEGHQLKRTYIAYALLPLVILPPLTIIMCNFSKHCRQEEYISFCQDQEPPSSDDCDCDVPTNCSTQAKPTSSAVTYDLEAAQGEHHDVCNVPTEYNLKISRNDSVRYHRLDNDSAI